MAAKWLGVAPARKIFAAVRCACLTPSASFESSGWTAQSGSMFACWATRCKRPNASPCLNLLRTTRPQELGSRTPGGRGERNPQAAARRSHADDVLLSGRACAVSRRRLLAPARALRPRLSAWPAAAARLPVGPRTGKSEEASVRPAARAHHDACAVAGG